MSWAFVNAILLLLVIGFIVFQVSPAMVQFSGPIISIFPSQGSPGDSITISGQNFGQNQMISINYDGTYVGMASTGSGSWTESITVPSSILGYHTIEAGGATATFIVTGAGIHLEQTNGPPGSVVKLIGSGEAIPKSVM